MEIFKTKLAEFDIPAMVQDKSSLSVYEVTGLEVKLKNKEDVSIITIDTLQEHFKEYFDPKDLRIHALEEELRMLKEQQAARKKRKVLAQDELLDIVAMFRRGDKGIDIAKHFDVSQTKISKLKQKFDKGEPIV